MKRLQLCFLAILALLLSLAAVMQLKCEEPKAPKPVTEPISYIGQLALKAVAVEIKQANMDIKLIRDHELEGKSKEWDIQFDFDHEPPTAVLVKKISPTVAPLPIPPSNQKPPLTPTAKKPAEKK